ncbi:MAG: MFS transporter, partial [Candidatus Omnitrophica bacterium]|nr:MFS transporter [Candidatus Omnitrophota bacterium]
SFFQFLSKIKTSNFTKFVFFVSLMSFSVNLAAPFFAVLMLKDLHFNYLTYSLIVIVAPLTLYLNIQRWGHHADHVGNLKILKLTTRLIAIIPLLWVINQNPIYLILVEMFSGFLWAGFNLSTANFIYDAVSPEKRTRCIAYFNVINAAGLSTGALVGGFLIKHLPDIFEYKILTLFLVSSSLRLAVSWIFPGILKEVRTVKNVHSAELFFSMIRLRPILGDRRNIRA